jgi:hemerythrin
MSFTPVICGSWSCSAHSYRSATGHTRAAPTTQGRHTHASQRPQRRLQRMLDLSTKPGSSSWTESLRLGFAPLDTVHEDFVDAVQVLLHASDDAMVSTFADVERRTQEHFDTEERWMAESGFPARDCHVDEHSAVRRSMHGVSRLVARGDFAAARRFATAILDWLPGHTDYMDAALAHWMCKREHGGQPLVFRRGASRRELPLTQSAQAATSSSRV